MKMRKLAFMAAIALTFGVLAGLPSTARALTFNDTNDLGNVNPGEPASEAQETIYVNNLISLAPGSGLTAIDGHNYFRTSASCGTCPAATGASKTMGPFVDNGDGTTNVNLGTGGFTYLLAKYDGPNGGSEVWNVQGLTGVITIPLVGLAGQNFGLSHYTLFGGVGGVPDGGTTVMLLGAALGALGMARRFLKR
jgi:hypothetical protein